MAWNSDSGSLGTSKHRQARVHCGRTKLHEVARWLNDQAKKRAADIRGRAGTMYDSVQACMGMTGRKRRRTTYHESGH